jgi:hypothetical protein
VDLPPSAAPLFLPLFRWLLRSPSLMACLRPWNAPLDPRLPCFSSLKVVSFASPPLVVYMQRLNALWCCCSWS